MIRGMETAARAMKAQTDRQEVLGRNLVNLRVPGYKQETPAVNGFVAALDRAQRGTQDARFAMTTRFPVIGDVGLGTTLDRISVDFSQGQLEQTGRGLDVALEGDGFLVVRTPEGDLYSRGGALHLEGTGRLLTEDGYPVLSTAGEEIYLPGGSYTIQPDGTILADGNPVDRMDVIEVDPGTEMVKAGQLLYAPADPAAPIWTALSTTVKGGYMEQSNVDDVSTLSEMASLVRIYQANQRMLQAEDELLGRAVNDLGKV